MYSFNFSVEKSYKLYASLALTGPELKIEKDILLIIEKGLITGLEKVSSANLSFGDNHDFQVIKLDRSLTLVPCLIDAHVHLALDGINFKDSLYLWDHEEALQTRIEKDLQAVAEAGIGAVRDGGDCRRVNLAARNGRGGASRNDALKPRVVSTGEAVRRENGYGSFLGRGYRKPQEIPAFIETLHVAGVDQVKVIASGLVNFNEYDRVDGKPLAPEELKAVVFHAHRWGLKVMAHASSDEAVKVAVRAGVDSIEHGYFVKKDTLQLMADSRVAWVPTIAPVAALVDGRSLESASGRKHGLIKRIYEEHIEKLLFALDSGVVLGVGSDAGAPGVRHGAGLFTEMDMYARGALSNRTILKAATLANAQILGLDGKMGAISRGFLPELIAVQGNPIDDLSVLKQVQMRFGAGKYGSFKDEVSPRQVGPGIFG